MHNTDEVFLLLSNKEYIDKIMADEDRKEDTYSFSYIGIGIGIGI